MEAPRYVCEAIEKISPWARIGWNGKNRTFAIIDLYPAKLAKATYRELWGDRGPIFGSSYDHLARTPIWIEDVSPISVHDGSVISRVRRLASPIRKRIIDSWKDRQADRKREIRELAGKQGEYTYWLARRDPHRGHVIADKFISKQDKAMAAGDWVSRLDLEKPPSICPIGLT